MRLRRLLPRPCLLVVGTALLAGPLLQEAQAQTGPTGLTHWQLSYRGYIEGSPAAVMITFDDNRLPALDPTWGLYNAGGLPAWRRVNSLIDGHLYVKGDVFDLNYGTQPADNGTIKSVTLNSPSGNLFFRLKY